MALLTIGDFARASGLTPKALRLYDELGLVVPAEVDAHSGYRRYAPSQLDDARLVATLRLVGMPLARIRGVLDRPATAAAQVTAYWRQVEADTASRREIVADLVRTLEERETPMHTTTPTLRAEAGTSHRQGGRPTQQDAVLTTPDTFAVADGTGTRDDLAEIAVRSFASDGYAAAVAAVVEATPDERSATTLTAVALAGGTARITHVGDARVHLVSGGTVRRLTSDHTFVAALIEAGELTEDEARSHPDRSLLNRALDPRVEADELAVDVSPGDRLVLTTDGVHSTLEPAELEALLLADGTPQEVATQVGDAVDGAGAPDNHTVVVVDLRPSPVVEEAR